jgi:hypothetical protein
VGSNKDEDDLTTTGSTGSGSPGMIIQQDVEDVGEQMEQQQQQQQTTLTKGIIINQEQSSNATTATTTTTEESSAKEVNNNVALFTTTSATSAVVHEGAITPPAENETDPEEEEEDEDPVSAYVLNADRKILVESAEQWLCIGRLPRDFTEDELLDLVEEYGQVEETIMIHSEKTGKTEH